MSETLIRVVVTGATGFVGGALARRLLKDGRFEVTVAGRKLERVRDLLDAGARGVAFDLTDPASFPRVVAGQSIVLHCAAWIGGSDATLGETLNVTMCRKLAEAAAAANCDRFVLVSSVSAYGLPPVERVTEDIPVDPDQSEPYGATKARGELETIDACSAAGLEWSIVRPGMVYGPGSRPWTRNLLRMIQKRSPVMVGEGDGLVFPVFIDNLVDALLLAATHPEAANTAFHISDGPVTFRDFLGYYARMADMSVLRVARPLAWLIAQLAPFLPFNVPLDRHRYRIATGHYEFDTTRARTRLGWSPRVDLEEGMRQSERWLRELGLLD